MNAKVVGNILLALARIVVYVITGVQLGSDGKEVICDEAPSSLSSD